MRKLSKRWLFGGATLAIVAVGAVIVSTALAGGDDEKPATGLGHSLGSCPAIASLWRARST